MRYVISLLVLFILIICTQYWAYGEFCKLERKMLGFEIRIYRLESQVVHLMNLDDVVKGMVPRLEWAEERVSSFHYRMDVLDSRATELEKKIFPEKFKVPEYPEWRDD